MSAGAKLHKHPNYYILILISVIVIQGVISEPFVSNTKLQSHRQERPPEDIDVDNLTPPDSSSSLKVVERERDPKEELERAHQQNQKYADIMGQKLGIDSFLVAESNMRNTESRMKDFTDHFETHHDKTEEDDQDNENGRDNEDNRNDDLESQSPPSSSSSMTIPIISVVSTTSTTIAPPTTTTEPPKPAQTLSGDEDLNINKNNPEEAEEKVEDVNENRSVSPPKPAAEDLILSTTSLNEAQIEISHEDAINLCLTLDNERKNNPDKRRGRRAYLWAPIYHYNDNELHEEVPSHSLLMAPLVFKGGRSCLKWKLRDCNGTERFPLLKPCSYWIPQPLKGPHCPQHNGEGIEDEGNYVDFRPEGYTESTSCPCRWPCTPFYDDFQYCRAEKLAKPPAKLPSTPAYQISEYEALQLCRGIKELLHPSPELPIKVDSIPFRLTVKKGAVLEDPSTCAFWKLRKCRKEDDKHPGCGIWMRIITDGREQEKCIPETEAEKKKPGSEMRVENVPICPGGWPCFLSKNNKKEHPVDEEDPSFSSSSSCNCDYPCLPFFEGINKCYDKNGKLLVDANGRRIVKGTSLSSSSKNSRKRQKQFILCLHNRERKVDCFIKI